MTRSGRWQYQARAQPVADHEALIPSFGWFQQQPGPLPRPTRPEGFLAQPEVVVAAPAAPDFGWFNQQPEPLPKSTRPALGFFVRGRDATEIAPDFGWFHQESDPQDSRPTQPFVAEGFYIRGVPPIVLNVPSTISEVVMVGPVRIGQAKAEPPPFENLPAPEPDFGWFWQPPMAPIRPTRPEGLSVLGQPPRTPSFGWFQQEPDVIRPPHQTRSGFFARGLDDTEIAPAFGWFTQEPDVIRPRHQTRPGLFAIGQPVILAQVDFDWFAQEPAFARTREPLVQEGFYARGRDPTEIAPDFGWFVQGPDVIRPRHQVRPGLFVRGRDATEIAPDFGWFSQEPEPLPTPTRPEGLSVRGPDPSEFFVVPDFGWFAPPADAVRRLTRPEGLYVLGQPPRIPSFGWFEQEPDVVRPRHQVDTGHFALVREPVEILVDLDWLVQEPDFVRARQSLVQQGFFTRGYDPTELSLDFGWFNQQSGPLPKPRLLEGLLSRPEVVVVQVPDFGWFLQQPDVVRPEHQVRPGLSVLGQPPRVPNFGWFVPPADVVRPKSQIQFGHFALVREPVEILVDFDWFNQQADVVRRPVRLEGMSAIGQPPKVPDFGWFQQQSGPLPAPRRPDGFIARPQVFIVVPDFGWFGQRPEPLPRPHLPEGLAGQVFVQPFVPDFGWFMLSADVVRPLPRPRGGAVLGKPPILPDFGWHPATQPDVIRSLHQVRPGFLALPPLGIGVPTPPLEFFVQICLVLWELQQNGLLPDPSGFLKILIAITPSGYVKENDECAIDEEVPDPSGYEADDDMTGSLPSIVKDDELPPPSGYTKP